MSPVSPHVRVDRDHPSARFWLEPVDLARRIGFPLRELRRIKTLVDHHREHLLEAWYSLRHGMSASDREAGARIAEG